MRIDRALLLGLTILALPAQAAPPAPRYGVATDLERYPQGTPEQALASVLKAIDAKRFDYLVAQLADPTFIDDRIKRVHGGRFADQVEDTRANLTPLAVKQLRRFLKEGEWVKGKSDEALLVLPKLPKRVVRLQRRDGRWYLEHRSAPPPAPKKE